MRLLPFLFFVSFPSSSRDEKNAIFLHRFCVCCINFFDVVAFLRACVSLDFTSDEKLTDKNNAHVLAL